MKLGGLHFLVQPIHREYSYAPEQWGIPEFQLCLEVTESLVKLNRAKHPKRNLGEGAFVAFALRFAVFTSNGHLNQIDGFG